MVTLVEVGKEEVVLRSSGTLLPLTEEEEEDVVFPSAFGEEGLLAFAGGCEVVELLEERGAFPEDLEEAPSTMIITSGPPSPEPRGLGVGGGECRPVCA